MGDLATSVEARSKALVGDRKRHATASFRPVSLRLSNRRLIPR